MISFLKKYKNFGLLEFLVVFSFFYVASTLIWTASTRSAVERPLKESAFIFAKFEESP